MRGISEEKLKSLIFRDFNCDLIMADDALEECRELTHWLPIDNAPWNKPLLVYYPTMPEGLRIKTISCRVNWDSSLHKPTHYQELPGDPECEG